MKSLAFHPAAIAETQAEALYYESRSAGLGTRFVEQIRSALELAKATPTIGSPYLHGTRRVFPKDFPHSIIYRETADRLIVFAVAAFRRRPGYWSRRG